MRWRHTSKVCGRVGPLATNPRIVPTAAPAATSFADQHLLAWQGLIDRFRGWPGEQVGNESVQDQLADVIEGHWHYCQRIAAEVDVEQIQGDRQGLLAAGKRDCYATGSIETKQPAAPEAAGQSKQVCPQTDKQSNEHGPGGELGCLLSRLVAHFDGRAQHDD